MIYADFEINLVSENNGKQNPDESHTNKYQNHVFCSFGYKILCVHDQLSKPFILNLGQCVFICLSLIWSKKVNIPVS